MGEEEGRGRIGEESKGIVSKRRNRRSEARSRGEDGDGGECCILMNSWSNVRRLEEQKLRHLNWRRAS